MPADLTRKPWLQADSRTSSPQRLASTTTECPSAICRRNHQIKRPPEGGLSDPISVSDFTRWQYVGDARRSVHQVPSQDRANLLR